VSEILIIDMGIGVLTYVSDAMLVVVNVKDLNHSGTNVPNCN